MLFILMITLPVEMNPESFQHFHLPNELSSETQSLHLQLVLKKLVIFHLVAAQLQELQTIQITSAYQIFDLGMLISYNWTGNLNPLNHVFACPAFDLSILFHKVYH